MLSWYTTVLYFAHISMYMYNFSCNVGERHYFMVFINGFAKYFVHVGVYCI